MKNKKKDILNNIKETGFKVPEDYFLQVDFEKQKINQIHTPGFKVPKNYFENFEDSLQTDNKLDVIKSTGFTIPENYFENIEDTLHLKSKKGKIISLLNKSQVFKNIGLAIAASVVLFFSISKFNFTNKSGVSVANDEIEAWIDDGLVSFNTYEIEDVFSDEDLNLVAEESNEVSDYLKFTDIEVLLIEN